MVKRIPCRIVRTEPLGNVSNASDHVSRPNNFHHKIGYLNPQRKSTNDKVIYTKTLEITSISLNNSSAGQILDCYA